MANLKTETFTLTDAEGNDHTYEVYLHPAQEGAKISTVLLSSAAKPITSLLQGLLETKEGLAAIAGALKGSGASGLASLDMSSLPLAQIGADLQEILAKVDTTIYPAILKNTLRDGKKLSQAAIYDAAYAGNYAEMYLALGRVIQINGFFPLPRTLLDGLRKPATSR